MKKILIKALIVLVLILASCGDSDTLTFIKENSGAPDTIIASYTVDIGRSAKIGKLYTEMWKDGKSEKSDEFLFDSDTKTLGISFLEKDDEENRLNVRLTTDNGSSTKTELMMLAEGCGLSIFRRFWRIRTG